MSQWIVDPAKANQLNLRSGKFPAPVVAVLPAGTEVAKLQVLGSDPQWWQVRADLSGSAAVGYAHSAYLSPAGADDFALADPAGYPASNLALSGHKRTQAFGQANPLDEPAMPRRVAGLAQETLDIIAYLDPENAAHKRYQAGAGKTFCNIYAYDFCQRMGVYLPRVWWKAQALAKLAAGQPVAVAYGTTVSELNANALHDWLIDYGPGFGWTRCFTAAELQACANGGGAAIIVAKRANTNLSGHIVGISPESAGLKAGVADGVVVRPVQSQAGAVNFNRKVPATRWWSDAKFRSFGFWTHA